MVRQPHREVKSRAPKDSTSNRQRARLKPRTPMDYESREATLEDLRHELQELESQFETTNLSYDAGCAETSEMRARDILRLVELRVKVARMEGTNTIYLIQSREKIREALERRESTKAAALQSLLVNDEELILDEHSIGDLERLLGIAKKQADEVLPQVIAEAEGAEKPDAQHIKYLKMSFRRVRDTILEIEQYLDGQRDWETANSSGGKKRSRRRYESETTVESTLPPETNRRNPSGILYTDTYKGQMLGIGEWVRVAIRGAQEKHRHEAKGKISREVAVGNLILVLSQVAFWSEPDDKGVPRCDSDWRVKNRGIWWLVLRPSDLAKQTVGNRDAVRRAISRLGELGLIEIWTPSRSDGLSERHYGRNTWYVRLRWEEVEPAVQAGMKSRIEKRSRGKKSR